MLRLALPSAVLALVAAPVLARSVRAQDAASPIAACTHPDSIAVRGNVRLPANGVRTDAGVAAGDTLNYRTVQRAIKALYATGQFSTVKMLCSFDDKTNRATVIFEVKENPVVGSVTIRGNNVVKRSDITDRIDLFAGQPLDAGHVSRSIQRIDSLYQSEGYYLAKVKPETTMVADKANLTFTIDEGRRLAVSGVQVEGNKHIAARDIAKAMQTKPEGFWFWKRGEFDEEKLAGDVGERIPKLYAERGFADAQLLKDTLIVDRDKGKGLVKITIDEGPQYRVGSFEVLGNRRFSTDEVKQFFPFGKDDPSLRQQVTSVFRKRGAKKNEVPVFNQAEWDAATEHLKTAYNNEGYIYAQVHPIVERAKGADSVPTVNLRWEIDEKTPATINKVEIVGNDFTTEACIRDNLLIYPGDVFNQDRLIRSYQNIGNMGFFEAPLPPPDTRQANDKGDVDIVFKVKEKRTGNINFGASLGQGTGVGGFLGLDQPNLFGQCKRASLQWNFSRYLNDFSLSYTDPRIKETVFSGTVTGYHRQSRIYVADIGRITSTGGSLQLGLPAPWSPITRLFVSYGGERAQYTSGFFDRDTLTIQCNNCFRSTLGFTALRETRAGLPFPFAGSQQTFTAQFNGGPLGGTSSFQRYTSDLRYYAPLGQIGGSALGSEPIRFVFGLTNKAGMLFGNPGPFLATQGFSLGGVQYGELLRGYDELSITPAGYVNTGGNLQATRASFGSAFITTTAEVGVRFNGIVYTNVFYDAGNIFNRPRDLDPTRLFRGAGVGVSLVTPLGPLGLDWAYGFDRLSVTGQPDPKWQLHFRLGNLF
ncbi:MAG: outer membrane protein assembly factor BamA [Gemmatimonadota bacterium]|nr:outer membrane protein assembly factor BamA [Gemmatimonadota bacterium]